MRRHGRGNSPSSGCGLYNHGVDQQKATPTHGTPSRRGPLTVKAFFVLGVLTVVALNLLLKPVYVPYMLRVLILACAFLLLVVALAMIGLVIFLVVRQVAAARNPCKVQFSAFDEGQPLVFHLRQRDRARQGTFNSETKNASYDDGTPVSASDSRAIWTAWTGTNG
jgi:hypothetical protein